MWNNLKSFIYTKHTSHLNRIRIDLSQILSHEHSRINQTLVFLCCRFRRKHVEVDLQVDLQAYKEIAAED